jgi:hypothetical protein
MPWTNSYGQQLHPPQTPYIGADGKLTMSGRYQLLALWTRTGKGTGIVPQVGAGLAAGGDRASNAVLITNDQNQFTTVNPGQGCMLPALKPGQDVQVINDGAHSLNCYPQEQAIDALASGDPYVLAAGEIRVFQGLTVAGIKSYQLPT